MKTAAPQNVKDYKENIEQSRMSKFKRMSRSSRRVYDSLILIVANASEETTVDMTSD